MARLIGAPPGYVGYDEGGQLTEAIRRRPYAVVLFDEIEKAHPDVFNVLLQVLDDGRLTDGKGRTVDFRNTVLIMTSNVACDLIQEMARRDGDDERLKDQLMEALRRTFRPEFLNRIDEIVTFRSLGRDEIQQIVDIQLEDLRKRLAERKITLELTRRGPGRPGRAGLRSRLRRAAAQADDPAHDREPARGRGAGRPFRRGRPHRGRRRRRHLPFPQGGPDRRRELRARAGAGHSVAEQAGSPICLMKRLVAGRWPSLRSPPPRSASPSCGPVLTRPRHSARRAQPAGRSASFSPGREWE